MSNFTLVLALVRNKLLDIFTRDLLRLLYITMQKYGSPPRMP